MAEYKSKCFCGAVEFTVSGEPVAMGYCHCESCRHWSDNIGTYNKTPGSYRKWCKTCGGHLFAEHPPLKLTDVFAALLPALKFTPGVHVNYQETVLRMRDGLPKLKDFPKEFGGSGEALPE
jgi:hypothetical protein